MTNSTNKLYPMFVTTPERMAALRAFYVDGLGWKIDGELPNYLSVRSGDEESPQLSFMTKSVALGELSPFTGQGVIVSVPVANADAHHDRAQSRGLVPDTAPTDRPWGWRSYLLRDPIGTMLDFFHVLPRAS